MSHTTSPPRRAGRHCMLAVSVLAIQLLTTAVAAEAATSVFLDAPRQGAVVGQNFHLGGWAIDWASTTGTGIQTVHVWAYPASGAAPVFLGVPVAGARPDVAAAFGANFRNCGFGLSVHGLAPGDYMIAIFPYSQILGGFDFGSAISVNVRVVAAGAPSASAAPPRTAGPAPSGAVRLRVLQWNTHHGGFGTDGRYDPDRLATWMAKMRPDVIMLNEIEKFTGWGNEDQPARYKALIEAKTGRKWYSVFSQEFGDWSANGKGHLILSTYPIDSIARELISYDRVIGEASITVNGRNISLIVTHLDPASQTRRLAQAKEVTAWASSIADNRILTGDMNAWPNQTSIAQLNTAYRDSWTEATHKGTAYSYAGLAPDGATKNGRIDYIFFSKSAPNLVVIDSRVYDTRVNNVMPSDHRPVLTTFEVR